MDKEDITTVLVSFGIFAAVSLGFLYILFPFVFGLDFNPQHYLHAEFGIPQATMGAFFVGLGYLTLKLSIAEDDTPIVYFSLFSLLAVLIYALLVGIGMAPPRIGPQSIPFILMTAGGIVGAFMAYRESMEAYSPPEATYLEE
ncbi:MAG: hypothetical protein AB7G80_08140 [Dongiaceae bacterium]